MALKKKGMAVETAVAAAEAAKAEGLRVLVLRFNEKLTDIANSGSPVKAVNAGIAAVESVGWRFEGLTVEKDDRTLGDRMAFYATFRTT